MEVFEIEGFRSKSKLYHTNDGFFFNVKCARENSKSMKCIQNGCPTTGIKTINYTTL